jgi:hypothetical protein
MQALTVTTTTTKKFRNTYYEVRFGGVIKVGVLEDGSDAAIRDLVAKSVDGGQLTAEAMNAPIMRWSQALGCFVCIPED